MKKILLLILAVSLIALSSNAQIVCVPDTSFISAGAGLYPVPDTTGGVGVDSTMGINKNAVNGEYWEFVWTAIVPDSFPFNGANYELEYIKLEGLSNLPMGISSYDCIPNDCKFEGGTQGCVTVYGTPNDTPMDYLILISTKVKLGPFASELNIDFPNTQFAPGEYVLTLEPPVNTTDLENSFSLAKASPNPFSSFTNINFSSTINAEIDFKVYNLLGKQIYDQKVNAVTGENTIRFNGADLNSGVYMYSIGKGNDIITNRIVVSK